MTGVSDQAACRAGVSEAGMGLTARWPPSQSCASRQRTAQAVTLGPAGSAPWPGLLIAAGWDRSPSPTESMPLGALPGKSLISEVVWAPQSVGEPRRSLRYKDTGHTRVTPPRLFCSSATFKHRVLSGTTVILPGNKRPVSPLPPTLCPHLQSQRSTCMSMCYLIVHIQSCLIQQNVLKTYLICHLTT